MRYGLASAALIPEAPAAKQPASTLPPAGYAEQKTELWHMLELATNYIREISIAARRKESKKNRGGRACGVGWWNLDWMRSELFPESARRLGGGGGTCGSQTHRAMCRTCAARPDSIEAILREDAAPVCNPNHTKTVTWVTTGPGVPFPRPERHPGGCRPAVSHPSTLRK